MTMEPTAASAIQISETGGYDKLHLVDVMCSAPDESEITVAVSASGVNFIDTYHRSGLYQIPLPAILGQEGAGVVLCVGAGVKRFKAGDRVAWAGASGSYATTVNVPASVAFHVPEDISLHAAAAVALQGLTAHYLAKDCPPLKPGMLCLIHAAAGGVGRLLVQIAKLLGAHVVATVGSEPKERLALSAGADHVVNYAKTDMVAAVERAVGVNAIDVVYDGVGASVYDDSLRLLKRRGSMVSFGNASGAVPPKPPLHLASKSLWLTRPKLSDFIATTDELDTRISDLFQWVTSNKLKVRVEACIPLTDAAKAHKLLQSRKISGKILLIPTV